MHFHFRVVHVFRGRFRFLCGNSQTSIECISRRYFKTRPLGPCDPRFPPVMMEYHSNLTTHSAVVSFDDADGCYLSVTRRLRERGMAHHEFRFALAARFERVGPE